MKSRSEQNTCTKVEKLTIFPPTSKSWKAFKYITRRSRGGRQKLPIACRTFNCPSRQEITLNTLNSTWVLELNGLELGQKGIECLFVRFTVCSPFYLLFFSFFGLRWRVSLMASFSSSVSRSFGSVLFVDVCIICAGYIWSLSSYFSPKKESILVLVNYDFLSSSV
jgi:hypothetical protein